MLERLSASSHPPRRRRKARNLQPARHSLNEILQQNAGTPLFVRPVCWTDTHTRLLGASFVELPACDTPRPGNVPGSPPSRGHLRPSQAITTLSETLTEILMPDALHPILTSNAVRTIMSMLWPAAFDRAQLLPEFHIFFGDRVYRDAVRTQVMWNYPADGVRSSQVSFSSISTRSVDSSVASTPTPSPHNPANLPMMCYIGKNQLASMRKNLFRVPFGPERGWNAPVVRLQRLRARCLVPDNTDYDAHFVAIFLVMAQRHFYGAPRPSPRRDSLWSCGNGRPERPAFEDIKLRILTHDNETAEFIVYTAVITARFLDRFHEPACAPSHADGMDDGAPGMQIEFTRVPIWPILGLRERLGKALGEEVVGQFDASVMETWEESDAEGRQRKDSKRRREALSEVLNGSFEEDTGSDEQCSPLNVKRRRLAEGSPVGVVA
ncbi:hypothetical protein AAL_03049 [Moelleriella libera RCEF 2490]|uniref:Uncharacterized protein n=1 Tax=Moelleriella libera RCEF 2490 TaxID=1081109 RepID=A0A168E8F2_9HYPO|nr:hypothetical protein AAL_03049 [Moelleriella libera RCEF 2490]